MRWRLAVLLAVVSALAAGDAAGPIARHGATTRLLGEPQKYEHYEYKLDSADPRVLAAALATERAHALRRARDLRNAAAAVAVPQSRSAGARRFLMVWWSGTLIPVRDERVDAVAVPGPDAASAARSLAEAAARPVAAQDLFLGLTDHLTALQASWAPPSWRQTAETGARLAAVLRLARLVVPVVASRDPLVASRLHAAVRALAVQPADLSPAFAAHLDALAEVVGALREVFTVVER